MIEIDLGSLVDLDKMLKAFPERTRQAAAMAINQTAKREALTNVRRDMMRQVNWKTRYLQERTGIAKVANKNSLKASIYARDQPTMLNRFRPNPNSVPKRVKAGTNTGVRVRVKPTSAKVMKNAFVHQFAKSGNIAVMVRTKGGIHEPPRGVTAGGARFVSAMRAWILYAPSIDQVMWGTAEQNRQRIEKYLEAEFLRQFNRLSKL